MLQPSGDNGNEMPCDTQESAYVPNFPLSDYTAKQLEALKDADTVVSDPHKTGFIPYPAGGLSYRNGAMKSFVKKDGHYVVHDDQKPEMGIWGVEGSQPGAASVGVLLSHRVNFVFGKLLLS